MIYKSRTLFDGLRRWEAFCGRPGLRLPRHIRMADLHQFEHLDPASPGACAEFLHATTGTPLPACISYAEYVDAIDRRANSWEGRL